MRFLFLMLFPVAALGAELTQQKQAQLEGVFTTLCSRVQAVQNAYTVQEKYLRISTNQIASKITLPAGVRVCRVDEYVGPKGKGYIVYAKIADGTNYYSKKVVLGAVNQTNDWKTSNNGN